MVILLGEVPGTQCAAVITQFGWMSEPPQNEKLPDRKEACHFHSHSVACWPFTIFALRSLLSCQGVVSVPLNPQGPNGGGVVGGPGVVVVMEFAQSFQPFFVTE